MSEEDKNLKFVNDLGQSILSATEPVVKLVKKYPAQLLIVVLTGVAVYSGNDELRGWIESMKPYLGQLKAFIGVANQKSRTRTLKKGSQYRRRR